MNEPVTLVGGCHCGAVRFEVDVSDFRALSCNCSICKKKAFLHVIVPKTQFRLLSGAESLLTYTFNTGVAKHLFCRHCGIHSFYRPRSHPDGVSVNLRCIDEGPVERFQIEPFDGANWEQAIGALNPDRSA